MVLIEEVCPYCDELVTATAYKGIIKCPTCGKYMVLCSVCEQPTCNHCKLEDVADELNEE